jgi:hypothetical protein
MLEPAVIWGSFYKMILESIDCKNDEEMIMVRFNFTQQEGSSLLSGTNSSWDFLMCNNLHRIDFLSFNQSLRTSSSRILKAMPSTPHA